MSIESSDVQGLQAIGGDQVTWRRSPFQDKATLAVRENIEGKQFWITIAGFLQNSVERKIRWVSHNWIVQGGTIEHVAPIVEEFPVEGKGSNSTALRMAAHTSGYAAVRSSQFLEKILTYADDMHQHLTE